MSRDQPTTDLLALRARVTAGGPLPPTTGLAGTLERRLVLAERLGAPLLPELDLAILDAAADADLDAELRVATAQARTVTAGLVVAPMLAVPALGALLDLDLVGFYGGPAGRTVLLIALVLHAAGVAWLLAAVHRVRRRAARAGADRLDDAELVRLVGVGVRAGMDAAAALRVAAEARPGSGTLAHRVALALELGTDLPAEATGSRTARTLHDATELGAPLGSALRALGEDLLRERRTRVREAAARLPALLTVPTALLVLPASLLVVGAPLLLEAVSALGG